MSHAFARTIVRPFGTPRLDIVEEIVSTGNLLKYAQPLSRHRAETDSKARASRGTGSTPAEDLFYQGAVEIHHQSGCPKRLLGGTEFLEFC
jgi:hypothetical protein